MNDEENTTLKSLMRKSCDLLFTSGLRTDHEQSLYERACVCVVCVCSRLVIHGRKKRHESYILILIANLMEIGHRESDSTFHVSHECNILTNSLTVNKAGLPLESAQKLPLKTC